MYRTGVGRTVRMLFALAILVATFAGHGIALVSAAGQPGAVYALSNAAAGNTVVVWHRASDGTLSLAAAYPTAGLGTGAGLGSQGALILSEDTRWLFAVNAGSNDISVFRVSPDSLSLTSRIASGGIRPTSLTVHGNLLYVLNAGDSGNITGFIVGDDGTLTQLADSTRPLSSQATAPAQVQFSPDGRLLVVTERATSRIDTYVVGADGRTTGPSVEPSSGAVPFGFAFGKRDQVFVSEAGGAPNGLSAASSYRIGPDGTLAVVSASIGTHQIAACWLVVTNDGRYAYTANAGSGSISGYSIDPDGRLSLLDADGRTGITGDATGPADMAFSLDSHYLYVRNGRTGTIGAYAVQADGSLRALPSGTGLPGGSAGLAAR